MRPIGVALMISLSLTQAAPGPTPRAAATVQLGLRVPPGFQVTEYADSRLANDIFSLTCDPRGRVVVSGPGYIRILVDDDNDGRADRAVEFAAGPKEGAQGLLWEGDFLYCTGDGGLRRYRVRRDGRAAGPSELIQAMHTGGEHCAHAIRRGPDGWLYVLCGNSTGIDRAYASLPTSPIRDPVAGCVLRFPPDLHGSEIVADGFRNAYRMDFNADGELFTFDSDNERCVSLPWYEPTRFYHVIPGGHHGWRSPQRAEWWRLPPYSCDVVAPVAYLGRGSPTGVVCYRHTQFPDRYCGGMFVLDWTFGRVYFLELIRSGATYTCRQELFLEAVGENGFAPTDAAVDPTTGDLFISIGGRGTRGAVYRVRYPAGLGHTAANGSAGPTPPRTLEWRPALASYLPRTATEGAAPVRLRALTALRRHRDRFEPDAIQQAVRANWDYPDRYVRGAAADLLATLCPRDRRALGSTELTPLAQATFCLGSYRTDPADVVARAGRLAAARDVASATRLAGVRLVQLALGGLTDPKLEGTIWEGYSARVPVRAQRLTADVLPLLRGAFPSGHVILDRELTRTLAMVEDEEPSLPERVSVRLTETSEPLEDIHYLAVLARLRGSRSATVTARVAGALLGLDRKLDQRHMNRDTNWPLRMAELHAELARKDRNLNEAMLGSSEFGRPEHALWTRCPGFDRRRAAARFLDRLDLEGSEAWNRDLVGLIGLLPAERCLPVLRKLWGRAGLDESILLVLAQHAQLADRDKFIEGLNSPQPATVRLCLEALEKLPAGADRGEVLALVRALRRLPAGMEADPLRRQVARRLQRLTGQATFGTDVRAWSDWCGRTYPEVAAQLAGNDGVDVAGWEQRLARLDWAVGDAERGHLVFARAACVSCHSGGQTLGPDLHGVASRFSRSDLFTAILQPSKDVSPRYRALLVTTTEGKLYQGLVVYEAADSLILQTAAATTVRIPVDRIAARRFTPVSLMPTGLLDKLTDREIADLYTYLRSLGTSQKDR
jgi:putative heme-binding domain-containing protein